MADQTQDALGQMASQAGQGISATELVNAIRAHDSNGLQGTSDNDIIHGFFGGGYNGLAPEWDSVVQSGKFVINDDIGRYQQKAPATGGGDRQQAVSDFGKVFGNRAQTSAPPITPLIGDPGKVMSSLGVQTEHAPAARSLYHGGPALTPAAIPQARPYMSPEVAGGVDIPAGLATTQPPPTPNERFASAVQHGLGDSPLPDLPVSQKGMGVGEGVGRGAYALAQELSKPENVAMMVGTFGTGQIAEAVGGVAKYLPKLIGTYFSGNMLVGAAAKIPGVAAAIQSKDYGTAAQLITQASGEAALGARGASETSEAVAGGLRKIPVIGGLLSGLDKPARTTPPPTATKPTSPSVASPVEAQVATPAATAKPASPTKAAAAATTPSVTYGPALPDGLAQRVRSVRGTGDIPITFKHPADEAAYGAVVDKSPDHAAYLKANYPDVDINAKGKQVAKYVQDQIDKNGEKYGPDAPVNVPAKRQVTDKNNKKSLWDPAKQWVAPAPAPAPVTSAPPVEAASLPNVGDEIEFTQSLGVHGGNAQRATVTELRKDPTTGDTVPIVNAGGISLPVAEYPENGRVVKPAAAKTPPPPASAPPVQAAPAPVVTPAAKPQIGDIDKRLAARKTAAASAPKDWMPAVGDPIVDKANEIYVYKGKGSLGHRYMDSDGGIEHQKFDNDAEFRKVFSPAGVKTSAPPAAPAVAPAPVAKASTTSAPPREFTRPELAAHSAEDYIDKLAKRGNYPYKISTDSAHVAPGEKPATINIAGPDEVAKAKENLAAMVSADTSISKIMHEEPNAPGSKPIIGARPLASYLADMKSPGRQPDLETKPAPAPEVPPNAGLRYVRKIDKYGKSYMFDTATNQPVMQAIADHDAVQRAVDRQNSMVTQERPPGADVKKKDSIAVDPVQSAKDRLAAAKKRGTRGSIPLGDRPPADDPYPVTQMFKDIYTVGQDALLRTGRNLQTWTTEMVKNYGEHVQPYLSAVWDKIQLAKPFYSQMERTLQEKMPNAASADQIRGILSNPNSGVKADEMKWAGMDDLLNSKSKLTKQEVLDHVRSNALQVNDITRKEEPDLEPKGWSTAPGTPGAKYAQYQTPGGKNYRETLLTIPPKEAPFYSDKEPLYHSPHFDDPNIIAHARMNDRTDADGKKMLFLEELQSDWHQAGRKKGYADPDAIKEREKIRNRLDELTNKADLNYWGGDTTRNPSLDDPGGLHGSDGVSEETRALRNQAYLKWLKSGQKYLATFHTLSPEDLTEYGSLLERRKELYKSGSANGPPAAPFSKNWHELAFKSMLRKAAEEGYDKLGWTTGDMQADRYDLSKQISKVELHDLGEDAPHPGERGLMAYDKSGNRVLSQTVTDDKLEDYIGKEAAKKLLEKEPTAGHPGTKKGAGGGVPWYDTRVLSGLDLKVGGEGMRGFYDKILPDFANKYGKKWGAKVEEGKIAGKENLGPDWDDLRDRIDRGLMKEQNLGFRSPSEARKYISANHNDWQDRWEVVSPELKKDINEYVQRKFPPQKIHSIPITPQMRKAVIFHGQPISKNNIPRGMTPTGAPPSMEPVNA